MIKGDKRQGDETLSPNNPFRKYSDDVPTKNPFNKEYDPSSVDKNTNGEEGCSNEDNKMNEAEEVDDGVSYAATPYDKLGLRIGSPPPLWERGKSDEKHDVQQPRSAQPPDIMEEMSESM